MTAAVVVVLVVTVAVWVRLRLAAAERTRVELEAFRSRLGLPAGRCQVIDVGPVQGWRAARRAVPEFRDVHAAPRWIPVVVAEVGR